MSFSLSDPRRRTPASALRTAIANVFAELTRRDDMTVSELAEAASVSRPTVQRALEELDALGLVEEAGSRPRSAGRPARTLRLGPGCRHVLAIDAQAAQSRVGIATTTGRVLATGAVAHARHGLTGERLHAIGDLIARLLHQQGVEAAELAQVVVSMPGIVGPGGDVVTSTIIPEWTRLRLAEEIAALLGTPRILVENDMNIRALGEMRTGVARHVRDFIYLPNHTAIRPALVLDRAIRRGAHLRIGEGDVLVSTGVQPRMLEHDGTAAPFLEVASRIDDGTLGEDWLDGFLRAYARIVAALAYPLDPAAVVISGGRRTTSPEALEMLAERTAALSAIERPLTVLGARVDGEIELKGALFLALHHALTRDLDVDDPPLPPLRGPDGSSELVVPAPSPPSASASEPAAQTAPSPAAAATASATSARSARSADPAPDPAPPGPTAPLSEGIPS